MDRAARVKFCEKCTKRGYGPKGIVCSLTGEHATFEGTCSDYNEDEKEAKSIAEYKANLEKTKHNGEPFELESKALGGGITVGALAMVGAVVWFVVGLSNGLIFWYPPVLFAVGTFGFVKGIIDRRKEIQKRREDAVLDADL